MGKNNSIRRRSPILNCIFCGEPDPTSEEHILARWIFNALIKNNIAYDDQREYTTSNKNGGLTDFIAVSAFDTTIPALCEDCNNHWGSDLQDEVAGTLRPFIIGGWSALDDLQRTRIVKWFTSYLMVRQFAADGHDVFTQQQREKFREDFTIPDNLNIWIAPINSVSLDSIHRGMIDLFVQTPSKTADIFIAVQAVGKVIFVALGADPHGNHGLGRSPYMGFYKCMHHHNLIPLHLIDPDGMVKFPKKKPAFCLTDNTDYLCNHGSNALQNFWGWFPGGEYRTQGKVLIRI